MSGKALLNDRNQDIESLPPFKMNIFSQIKYLRSLNFTAMILLFANTPLWATDWFVDSSASGLSNGTSWTNAWTSPHNITASVQPGDTVYISGGPTGTTKTYAMPTYWNPRSGLAGNRITYKIGQTAAHNGLAIFNYTGSTPSSNPWLTGVSHVNVSGDAGDGQNHFRVTSYTLGVSNTSYLKLEYIDASATGFSQFADLRSGGASTTGIEIGYCHIKVTDPNASNAIFGDVTGTTYDAGLLIHHCRIEVPYRSNMDGFGADGIDTNGSGITIHDCQIEGFSSVYTGGQHQDGWQGLGNSRYLKFYNNIFLNLTNYAIYGEAFSGDYTDVLIYNNLVMLADPSFALSVGSAGIVFGVNNGSRTFTNILIANNTIVDYGARVSIALNNVTSTLATFINCNIKNNAFVNAGVIDLQGNLATNVVANASITLATAPANFTSYALYGGLINNLRPVLTSGLVDAGVSLSTSYNTDITGITTRPKGAGWDIGAYEVIQTIPIIITQPLTSQVVAVAGTATITVLVRGQAPIAYQWKKDGINITDGGAVSGAQTATLTITGVAPSDAGTYTVEVNNALGPAVTSTGSVLTVGATAPSITTQPVVTQSVTWGTTVSFTVAATGAPSPGYQWKKDGVNLSDGGIVSGATSSTLTLTGVTGSYAGTYTVVVDNTVPPSVTSNNSVLIVNGIPVTITSQPVSQSVLLGNPVSFTVSATGTPAPTFQWHKNNVPIPGATGSTYIIGSSTANDAGSYSVTVGNIVGLVTSATATLSVSVVPVPTITSQPVALTVAAGRNVSFQITTTDAVSFQWQESTNGGTTWSNLINDATYSGVTSKTLTIANAPLTLNGRLYRAQAGNGTGGATSNAVTLGVTTPVFPSPASVVVSPTGNLLVSDRTQNVIQSVNAQRVANLLAGVANQQGSTNGNGNLALFRQPGGAVLDSAGNLYVADTGNSMIRKITPNGTVSTLAGSTSNQSYRDGNGTDAWFNSPSSVAIDGGGNLYVADTGNSVIRKIDPAGNVTTFAGTAGVRGSVDGNGPAARFNQPTGIAADSGGNLFVADTLNQAIRKITPNGAVITLAGLTGVSGSADGTGADALFNNPLGVAVDNLGNVYVSDSGNATIRRVSSAGVVTTYAGLPTVSGLMDGTGLDAWFNQPMGLSVDSTGNLYVADNGNAAIRRISSSRVVNTLVITQGSTPIPTPPPTTPTTPTPTPPSSPTPSPTSGGGGGGGAPSIWFCLAILAAGALRYRTSFYTSGDDDLPA